MSGRAALRFALGFAAALLAALPDARAADEWPTRPIHSSTPDALVEKIHAAIDKALDNPDVQRQLAIADIPGKQADGARRAVGVDEKRL